MVIRKKVLLAMGLSLLAIILALVILIGTNNVSQDNEQKIAADYFNGLNVDGYLFSVLNNSSEIPYTEGNTKDPSMYSGLIIPPIKDTWPLPVNNSSLESVKLYTWSDTDGLLIQWDVVISGGNVTMVNANLIDAGLGDYDDSNPGIFDACKNLMVSGTTVKDVFDQYRQIYENHDQMLTSTAINYINDRDLGGHALLVLNGSNDIPYKDGDFKKPDGYSEIIHPPVAATWPFRQSSDTDHGNIDSVSLYTWSYNDGLLIKWDVRIADDRAIQLNANLVDLEVGDYLEVGYHLPNNKSLFIPGKGVNLSGTYLIDILGQYAKLYRNNTSNANYYPVPPSFTSTHPPETRPLTIHFWNNYRSEFMAGEKCYIDGYVTEKTAAGIDLDSVNSKVDIIIKKGESNVFLDSNNDMSIGFRFLYIIPGNESSADYTVALTASKGQQEKIKYTNATATTTFRVVGAPTIDSIECEKSVWQYQGDAIFHAGQTCFVILWLDPNGINEPFLPEKYSAIINTTPAINQYSIRYYGWIIQNTGSIVRKGIVYTIYIPEDARAGQYQLDAKVGYRLGEGYSVVSMAKSGRVTISDRGS